ncbi:hypothetical protein NMG60_11035929 [Bertholletia excelsa]
MANFVTLKLACSVVLAMVVAPPPRVAEGAISCGMVDTSLAPCLNYLRNGGQVPVLCCNGVRFLYGAASTTADRRTACNCMKSAAGAILGLNINYASGLPGKCGLNIPYEISFSTDCSKVQ